MSGRRAIHVIPRFLRWTLVVILAWTSGAKLFFTSAFAERLRETGFLPEHLVPLIAVAVPVLELVLAITLAFRWCLGASLSVLVGLSTVFSGIHGYGLIFGVMIPCGCAGRVMTDDGAATGVILLGTAAAMSGISWWLLVAESGAKRATL